MFVALLAGLLPTFPRFSDYLRVGSTMGIWADGSAAVVATSQDRMSGRSFGGDAGVWWWPHHRLGLRAAVSLLSLKCQDRDGTEGLYYWGYGLGGEGALRFGSEHSLFNPYVGGFGMYYFPVSAQRTEGGVRQAVDTTESFVFYGGEGGVLWRLSEDSFLKGELKYGVSEELTLVSLSLGFSFYLLW